MGEVSERRTGELKKCQRDGCPLPAACKISIRAAASGDWPPGHKIPAILMKTDLLVCSMHKRTLATSDVCNDEYWDKIDLAMAKAGKRAPNRSTARLIFEPIA